MWFHNSTCTLSRDVRTMPRGRVRFGGLCRRWRMMPRRSSVLSARCAVKAGLVEDMNAFDSFPLGEPGFVSHILDRAAHLRGDEAKLLALESHLQARAYV